MENARSFTSSSSTLQPLSPTLFIPQFPLKLRLSRLKRSCSVRGQHQKRILVISNASGRDHNGFPIIPTEIFMEEAIGAEYGEGFETFRPDGPLKVNVADAGALKLNAWKQLASEEGKEIPEDNETQRLLLYAGAEHALHKVFLWEKVDNDIGRLKQRLSQLYYDNLLKLSEPVEGLKDWLDAVSTESKDTQSIRTKKRKRRWLADPFPKQKDEVNNLVPCISVN